MKLYIGMIWASICLIGCGLFGTPQEKEKCMTRPVAIFSDTMRVIQKHHFESDNNQSYEQIILSDSIGLEVFQSGCNLLKQEFRITRQGDFRQKEDDFWVRGAVETLGYLSTQSQSLMGLEQFAQLAAMALKEEDFKLGQAFVPQPFINITIDKIATSKEGKVIVIFEQTEG